MERGAWSMELGAESWEQGPSYEDGALKWVKGKGNRCGRDGIIGVAKYNKKYLWHNLDLRIWKFGKWL